MAEVKARYEAAPPAQPLQCKVVLNAQELSELMANIAYDLNYSSVYSHSNLFQKGDAVQKDPKGDLIGITMAGQVEGSISSASFDGDGLSLGSIRLVEGGKAINYFGANRFGQYLGETPTGNLRCLCVDAGTADSTLFLEGPYLEVVSMSGLQVDFYNDYIGGEIRLAYYHDGSDIIPVTGLSISGKLEDVLNRIRLSTETTVYNGYHGPKKAILDCMKIF
jgi:PmbA protein